MARRHKGKGRKGGSGRRKAKRSNQVPLPILEKRLTKLNRIVKSRGGDSY